jgi:hypothetical protein
MENVILLGLHDKFSLKATRIIYFVVALISITVGIRHVVGDTLQPFSLILGIALVGGGLYQFFLAITAFSRDSFFAPKIRLSEKTIEFKTGHFVQQPTKIDWKDIQSIELKSYRLIFHFSNTTQDVKYTTTYYISKEIKRAIIEYADTKGIQVL